MIIFIWIFLECIDIVLIHYFYYHYYYYQELGYRGEIGYQTFLYSNELEIRKVFMFLVDKLPKDTAETTEEPLGMTQGLWW